MLSIFKRGMSFISVLAMLLALSACVTSGTQPGALEIRRGKIEQITPLQLESNQQVGVGAVVGGLVGLGVGSLIGGGTGRDVAMVVGAIGGAVAGHEVQKRNSQPEPGQQVVVRLSNGVLVTVTQPENRNLRHAQAVYVEGSGQEARVVPQ